MAYFKHFPTVVIKGQEVLDITRKVRLSKALREVSLDYLSYTLDEGDKPEDIANYYYDNAEYAWLVLMANDIVDPYSEWYKTGEELNSYIKVQYESASGLTGDAVLEWSKNAGIASNIVFYRSIYDKDVQINRATYQKTPTGEFYAVRVYDREVELNESKREISLINKSYLSFIEERFTAVINGE